MFVYRRHKLRIYLFIKYVNMSRDIDWSWGDNDPNEEFDFSDTSFIDELNKKLSPLLICDSTKEYNDTIRKVGDNKYLILMFSTSWCGPCKQITPRLERFLTQKDVKCIKVLKINGDTCKSVLKKFSVSAFPTFIFIKDGSIDLKIAGADWPNIVEWMEKHIEESKNNPKKDSNTQESVKTTTKPNVPGNVQGKRPGIHPGNRLEHSKN